jgi:hypothetical protein
MGTTRRHFRLSMSVTSMAEVSYVKNLLLATIVPLSRYSIAVLQLARCERQGGLRHLSVITQGLAAPWW